MTVATAEDRLLAWRKEFPTLEKTTHLVSHSMGAMPRKAFDYINQYAQTWAEKSITAWDEWEPLVLEHGNLVGSLIGAPKDTVIMHQNVSTLTAIAISAVFEPGKRNKLVTTDLNFPSIHYNWIMHERLGLKVHVIKTPDGMTIPLEEWEKAVDDSTLAVMVDHGIFRSSFLQDVKAITKFAHARGAYSIVDAYQTTGCVPYDVVDWDADFVMGGSHKWLCGGPGAAWMYVKKNLIPKMEPRICGWFSHARPFAFELDMEFAPNAMRFATGTPGISALYAARAGTEIIKQVGVATIRKKSLRMTQKIRELAEANGLKVNTPEQRAGMICVDFPGADKAERELVKRKFLVDYRPKCGIRISPHFYTTDEEVERVFDEIKRLRKKK